MNLSSILSLFKKSQKTLSVPDTILIKQLKSLSKQSNLLVFKDVNIYHHSSIYTIPVMLLDDQRGLYLFETKEWAFNDLKNANIQKAQKQEHSENTLAFENTHAIIRKKFNEITHEDGVPIFNFLLMENLMEDEYQHLDESFKELLPYEKIIFSDTSQSDIFKKLQAAAPESSRLASVDTILGTLLVQYAILDQNSLHFANEQQREFIDRELDAFTTLNAPHRTGRSSTILLKSIIEALHNPTKKILILKPTTLACDIFKKELLEIIEHAIVEINLEAIEIITPLELINRHNAKLSRESNLSLDIDEKLLKSISLGIDTLICDDSDLYEEEFIHYLKVLQEKSQLLLVVNDSNSPLFLEQYGVVEKRVSFHKSPPYAKAMQLIFNLVNSGASKIALIASQESREKLFEDLEGFIEAKMQLLQSDVALINQKFERVLLCRYSDINAVDIDHTILMDIEESSSASVEAAFHISKKSVDVLYDDDSIKVKQLRKKYDKSYQE